MDKKVVELNSGWKIAYEENYKCKDYADDIYDIKTLKSKNRQDFLYHGKVIKYDDMKNLDHQGGYNVHIVIDYFLKKHKEKNCE